MKTKIWVLREAYLAYERFHGVFSSQEDAMNHTPPGPGLWGPVTRKVNKPMWDDNDPFDSPPGSMQLRRAGALWIVESYEV